ncbi:MULTISPECIES: JAB domain-containing protein [Levilactobacillus]|uniref:DNA repair protein n=1 Tax=Levilactobacillus paucivorans TaxID=616990 RepID=A0A0R2LYN3_9LACO|nr:MULTISPECIES: JAB domain-containing protein [Levilactobacillus]KRO04301.1 DNA repair protein [Levilactobacillus paucivorans]
MRQEQVTSQNERQLLGRVMRHLGLAETSEVERFFRYFHSLANLRYASRQQCQQYVAGLPRRRALLTAIDLGRWVQRAPRPLLGEVLASGQMGQRLMADLRYLPQERVEVFVLDAKHRILERQTVFQGTLTSCPVHPREIFQLAVMSGAAGVIIAHNHPSGSAEPSPNDLAFMHRLAACGELMGIPVLDGFVVGLQAYFSLREAGILPLPPATNKTERLKSD